MGNPFARLPLLGSLLLDAEDERIGSGSTPPDTACSELPENSLDD
jgi:hypothetical protein